MALFKGSVIGLGTLALLVIVWRIIVTTVAIGIIALKLLLFIVLPIALIWWLARKMLHTHHTQTPTA